MKLKYTFLLTTLLLCLAALGCKKFLAEQSQTLQYADNWQKLQEVLNGDGYMPHLIAPPSNSYKEQPKAAYFPWLNVMDDDIDEFVKSPYYLDTRDDVFGFYTWQANPFVDKSYMLSEDDTWAKVYVNINAANIIAKKATELTDNPAELKRIRGEALFLRAGYYFYMVNTYAGAYSKNTAATAPAVPLKITEYVEDKHYTRSTIDSVYKQMVTDLNTAESLLTDFPQTSIYKANINAVNILQSRVYLYMQDWQNAVLAASKVIARKPALYNLNAYKPQTSFYSTGSPEAVFTQGGNAMIYLIPENVPKSFQPSADLMNLYQQGDLRLNAFFEVDNSGKYRYAKMYRSPSRGILPSEVFSDNFFMRNAEAYLNKAEAEAMLGNVAAANESLNILRQSRFSAGEFKAVNLSGTALIDFVRDERRRELCFEGHRWFDLKRYAVLEKKPFTKTIVHNYSDAVYGSPPFIKASLTLVPGDPDYLLPIPGSAILFNQGVLKQNPARQIRVF